MDYQINFPNLGIHLPHVIKSIQIGPLRIAMYGLMIAVGMLLGISAVKARAKESGQSGDDYIDIAVLTMIVSVIGARIYYVIFSWDAYRDNPLSVFNIREGGLAIYGGIIAGICTILALSRLKRLPYRRVLDTCVIGVPVGQAIGRWGNFFNREAFGAYTDSLTAMQLPVSAVRYNEITEEMWAHAVEQNGVQMIKVHPTFLYESAWCVLVFFLLVAVRKRARFDGELLLVYLIAYGTGRFFIEQLRTDQLCIPGTGIPVSMVVSFLAVILSLAIILRQRSKT